VIIGTPGRLLDHFRAPYARLSSLKYLVLDEADRMLDMGFLPDIRRVLRHLPRHRQTLFFSATIPPPIVQLTREMLRDPATINMERRALPAVGITQAVYPVPAHLKTALLLELLKRGEIRDALVFTRTKHRADRLARALAHEGIKVERIHGNRSQAQRTEALAGFKSGKYLVLVATDIAARGIDVDGITHVVNYELPNEPETYVHRIGRTARAGAQGAAIALCDGEERAYLKDIERLIGRKIPVLQAPISRAWARDAPPWGSPPSPAVPSNGARPPGSRCSRSRTAGDCRSRRPPRTSARSS
jgi:ATP-dependent RNA helicase RhlE